MAEHNKLGKWGELKAIEYLQKKGYKILEHDWRYKHYDLDIIALTEDNILAIVEVRTRSEDYLLAPEETVNRQKIISIMRATAAYLRQTKADQRIRFDIVAIVKKKDGTEINHIEDAFYPIPNVRC